MVHDRNDIGEVGCRMRKEECCMLQDLVEIGGDNLLCQHSMDFLPLGGSPSRHQPVA